MIYMETELPGLDPDFLKRVANEIDGDDLHSIVLIGSRAYGAATEFSDVDIACYSKTERHQRSPAVQFIREGQLIAVKCFTPGQLGLWLTLPALVVYYLRGVLNGIPLIDKEEFYKKHQEIAKNFVWDQTVQMQADIRAVFELACSAGDVFKAIGGLKKSNSAKLALVRTKLPIELLQCLRVKLGVMSEGDDTFISGIYERLAADGHMECAGYLNNAFGIGETPMSLEFEVKNCLYLYREIARLFTARTNTENHLIMNNHQVIEKAVNLIDQELD